MFESGVDFITSGNHIFDKRDFKEYLENSASASSARQTIRPRRRAAAAGTFVVERRHRRRAESDGADLHAAGRRSVSLRRRDGRDLRRQTPVIFVDIHAEATSEKVALGRYLDGRVSCVFGTHTHVQTSDEQILPGGTAYISDVGMTGPTEGVIGMESRAVLDRFLTGIAERFTCRKIRQQTVLRGGRNDRRRSGKATEIKRIFPARESRERFHRSPQSFRQEQSQRGRGCARS